MEISVNKIAEWMFNEVKSAGILYQTDAVNYIINNFGETFIYVNENGNQAISKDVKKEFKKLHAGRAVWERDAFFWGWT